MHEHEEIIREAARQRRRVAVRMQYTNGQEYEREWEPYAIENGELLAFSSFRDEYRRVKLDDILSVEISPRTFEPRRSVDL
jgi:hypothetical protein